MSTIEINNLDDHQSRRSLSEERHSLNSSDDPISSLVIDDEDDEAPQELKSSTKPKEQSQISTLKNSKQLSTSMVITNNKSPSSLKWNSSLKTG